MQWNQLAAVRRKKKKRAKSRRDNTKGPCQKFGVTCSRIKLSLLCLLVLMLISLIARFDFKDAKGTLRNELEQIKRMRGLHPKSVKKHRKRVRVDNIRRTNQLPLNNIKAANTGKIVRISPVADFFSPPQSEKKSKLSTKNVKRKSKISAKKVKHEALAEYVEQANDIVENIDAANAFDEKFVFIAYGNDAFLPFFNNWICNTAKMKGVHARTLILATSLSMHKTLSQNRFKVRVSHLNLGRSDFNRNLDYDTYGYWKLVQLRVQALGHILYSGVSMLLFEPDAIWAQNPLEDRELFTPGYDIIGFSDDQGGMGFGWLLLKSNPKTIFLWKQVLRMTTAEISKFKGLRSNARVHLQGEQKFFNFLIRTRHKYEKLKDLKVKILSKYKYCSGRWYDGGRGGNGLRYRRQCRKHGTPFVVNNNWIVGNKGKIIRAKRWGHWFLNKDGKCDDDFKLSKKLNYASQTFMTLRPKHRPSRRECPKC